MFSIRGHYIIRFDDLCPTSNWRHWPEIEEALDVEGVKPIVAVVPDNQDPELRCQAPVDEFWARVRYWQRKGWTIALHGETHVLKHCDSGLVRLNEKGEFSGLPLELQVAKIQNGLRIFQENRVRVDMFAAPAHNFDENTLIALSKCGIAVISDGLFTRLVCDRFGIKWLPQQLWSFRYVPFSLCTICLHHNKWPDDEVRRFKDKLRRYRGRIVDPRAVIEHSLWSKLGDADWLFAIAWLQLFRLWQHRPKHKASDSPAQLGVQALENIMGGRREKQDDL